MQNLTPRPKPGKLFSMHGHVSRWIMCVCVRVLMVLFLIAPTGIPSPLLSAVNSSAINVTWLIPQQPNGQITLYSVKRYGRLINSVQLLLFKTEKSLNEKWVATISTLWVSHYCSHHFFFVLVPFSSRNNVIIINATAPGSAIDGSLQPFTPYSYNVNTDVLLCCLPGSWMDCLQLLFKKNL